jgi:HEAT repeat protein
MNEEIQKLINSLPEGGAESPGDAASRKIIEQLASHGAEAIKQIAGMLKTSEEGGDTKARLALHNLATFAAGQSDEQRKVVSLALVASLTKDRPADVQGFLIRQIQLCGKGEVVPALGERLLDADLGEAAALALTAIRDGAAAPMLAALEKADGRQKLVLVQSLSVLGEPKAAGQLRPLLENDSGDLRLGAAFGLAKLGSPEDGARLLALARREQGYARAKAVDAAFLLAERLASAAKTTERSQLLKDLRTLGEGTYVADAVDRALEAK